jgi:hypothetical protein
MIFLGIGGMMKAIGSGNLQRLIAVVLCQLFVIQSGFGQGAVPQAIRLVVVKGERAKNIVQQIPPEPLEVRVEDSNRRPLSGATVTFTAPGSGPGGQFANGSNTVTVTTNDGGLAIVEEYHPNGNLGPYLVQLRAEYRGQIANGAIEQSNVEAGRSRTKLIIVAASIAGVAVGAALLAHRGSGSTTAPTVTLGDSAVGAPKLR